jgi:hypothetical protein
VVPHDVVDDMMVDDVVMNDVAVRMTARRQGQERRHKSYHGRQAELSNFTSFPPIFRALQRSPRSPG